MNKIKDKVTRHNKIMRVLKRVWTNKFKLRILNNPWSRKETRTNNKKNKRSKPKTESNMKEHMEGKTINSKIITLSITSLWIKNKTLVRVNKINKARAKGKKELENPFIRSANNSCKKSWKSKINQRANNSSIRISTLESSRRMINRLTRMIK